VAERLGIETYGDSIEVETLWPATHSTELWNDL